MQFGLISHVLGMNIFGTLLNKLSKDVTKGYCFNHNLIGILWHLPLMCKSVLWSNWCMLARMHAHTHIFFCYPFCISIVLPCSWHENLRQRRVKTHRKTFIWNHTNCKLHTIWYLCSEGIGQTPDSHDWLYTFTCTTLCSFLPRGNTAISTGNSQTLHIIYVSTEYWIMQKLSDQNVYHISS